MKFELDNRLHYCKTGVLKLNKDEKNLLGISIGGGSPNCPVLYIVNVFDNGTVAKSGVLEPGDEILSINGTDCRSWSKQDLAKYIQSFKEHVTIGYSKIRANIHDGITPDIFLKKIKHRFIEHVSYDTADTLGLSRAILCNDPLAKKVAELDNTAKIYNKLKQSFQKNVTKLKSVSKVFQEFSNVFSEVSCMEQNDSAHKSYALISESHRYFGKNTEKLMEEVVSIVDKINTFVNKVIPDTKLTLQRYLNDKFEYLSFCLKVREIEDEDGEAYYDSDTAYRLETGNYDYRLYLRCRYLSRRKFLSIRNDLLEKLELLDQKYVQQTVDLLKQYSRANASYYDECSHNASCLNNFSIELSDSLNLT